MTTFTPADLTEGCLVSGTFYGGLSFTDLPLRRDCSPDRLLECPDGETRWFIDCTVADIKPAPKPVPLWADPAIPDDAWIASEHAPCGVHLLSVKELRHSWPTSDVVPAGWSNFRRVWLLDDTEVAVKRADIEALDKGDRSASGEDSAALASHIRACAIDDFLTAVDGGAR
jgi:hypothetical protein